MKKVLVALSGGVDSSVAALLLRDAGYEVATAYMKTWINEDQNDIFADCPWQQDIDDARAVAEHLNIPFQVVNLIHDYQDKVVNYLVQGYKNGTTPNPDIMCNREMKFGVFLDYALNNGFDAVATGHYCRKQTNDDNSHNILEGLDKNKDQSYFLALLSQHRLKHALFPIGELQKPQVRHIAQKAGLPNADKKDSQGICFLGKININDFLRQYIPDNPGPIVNTEGKLLGRHRGLHRFTIGQRKGIGIPSNSDFEKYVVIAKDFSNNRLVLAFEHPDAPGLYTRHANIRNLHFINKPLDTETHLLAKPRYRDPSQEITFTPSDANTASIRFKHPQRALAPGQLLALYNNDTLLGGGFYF